MTPERLSALNENINTELNRILDEHMAQQTKTEDQLLAETYARMVAVSITLGYDLSAMAESAIAAGDKIMDMLEQQDTTKEDTE
jgi:hypothetical protein